MTDFPFVIILSNGDKRSKTISIIYMGNKLTYESQHEHRPKLSKTIK